MEVFPLSPEFECDDPFETTVGPVDIEASDDECLTLADRKVKEITAAERQTFAQLMDEFAKGFDPDSLTREIMATLPLLGDDLFPGSFAHLLILLLQTDGKIETVQVNLVRWLRARYPIMFCEPTETQLVDETFFMSEIEMLRRLLSTLRGDDDKAIYWISCRPFEIGKSCNSLEASIRVIRAFERDMKSAIEEVDEERHFYIDLPVGTERTQLTSMRAQRCDSSQATIGWNNYLESEIELTKFHQYFKHHAMEHDHDKARGFGWLPPEHIKVPRSSAIDVDLVDVSDWSLNDHQKKVMSLLFKVAQWLGLARGHAPLHLFCDVARNFTIHKPSKKPRISYILFMQKLSEIRLCPSSIKSQVPTPFPYDDKIYADRNPNFFVDLFRSSKNLVLCQIEMTSFLKKKTDKKKPGDSNHGTSGRQSSPGMKIRMVTQFPEIHGSLAGAWEGSHMQNMAKKTAPLAIPSASLPAEETTLDHPASPEEERMVYRFAGYARSI
ncbi:uncharacterized protein CDV56_104685 [Aspergillus thermomutatus]|uniref:Uncharacterized protein n=1 Tax=Aspergillus thermomutatus TaxID=41047 RepID=A0A397GEB8_ASPTH|nr:uncharacterized protein CDV56_104685 [Aspergillus thermomutatus]RHZ47313.1 hypothetical protein CDV56_104685 [Aspergillus thermomutatus]